MYCHGGSGTQFTSSKAWGKALQVYVIVMTTGFLALSKFMDTYFMLDPPNGDP